MSQLPLFGPRLRPPSVTVVRKIGYGWHLCDRMLRRKVALLDKMCLRDSTFVEWRLLESWNRVWYMVATVERDEDEADLVLRRFLSRALIPSHRAALPDASEERP